MWHHVMLINWYVYVSDGQSDFGVDILWYDPVIIIPCNL